MPPSHSIRHLSVQDRHALGGFHKHIPAPAQLQALQLTYTTQSRAAAAAEEFGALQQLELDQSSVIIDGKAQVPALPVFFSMSRSMPTANAEELRRSEGT